MKLGIERLMASPQLQVIPTSICHFNCHCYVQILLIVSTSLHQHSSTQLMVPTGLHQHGNTQLMVSSGLHQHSNTQLMVSKFHLFPVASAMTWWVLLCVPPSDVTTTTHFWIHVELELVGFHHNFQPYFGHAQPWPPWPCDPLVNPTLYL